MLGRMLVIVVVHIVASELKDPICHSDECQMGSFSSEATICSALKLFKGNDKDVPDHYSPQSMYTGSAF